MTIITSKTSTWGLYFAAVLSAVGCGGRTLDSHEGTASPGDETAKPTDTPPPTCSQICRRAVDLCFPGGVIDQCNRDCEKSRTEYMGCKVLDAFLRCNLTAPVRCTEKVVIDGCYDERTELQHCKS